MNVMSSCVMCSGGAVSLSRCLFILSGPDPGPLVWRGVPCLIREHFQRDTVEMNPLVVLTFSASAFNRRGMRILIVR